MTFDPPWSRDLMSEEAKLELGFIMSFEIENRVSKSPIQSIDLSDFLINKEFDTFDIRNWLKDDLILIEKDLEIMQSFDWSIYKQTCFNKLFN